MEKKLQKNISSILQLIDSARFMASSLLNLVNNLSEEIYRIKCKFGLDNKKSHTCEGGAHLRISFWHLLMNLKNNY